MKKATFYLVLSSLCVLTCRSRAVESTPPPTVPAKVASARVPAHAGSWYSGDKAELQRDIESHLRKHAAPTSTEPVIALVGPHAGLRWSGHVAAAAYKQLAGQHVERAFLLGPTHHTAFKGIALPAPDMDAYATPLGNLRFDEAAIAALRGKPGFDGPARAHLPEHSLEMHAIFLAAVHPNAKLIPLVVGRVENDAAARALAATIRPLLKPGDVILTSSDFTHYGARFGYVPYNDNIPKRLMASMDHAVASLKNRDLEGFTAYLKATNDSICGREPIKVLLALLPEDAAAAEVGRDTSGHMTNDFSSSVSYLSVAWRRSGGWPDAADDSHGFRQGRQVLDADQQKIALSMVRKTLNAFLTNGDTLDDDDLSVPDTGPFRDTLSVFVTLKKHGQLRGCIGHILPIQPLWKDIRDNTISAAVRDTRFAPVTAAELADLHVEVSVLTPPVKIPSPDDFVVGRHGIIVSVHGRRAVYLPQVAPEQGWDRATTLTHLSRKAGLPGDAWQSDEARLEVFEAQVFGEPE